ncbi:MAG: hypothetical protein KAW12_16600 [Candidatus Aminicenantes bacterium]|nr:hypothetical protein [Candidatus Aminicenantes bacterium]
MSKNSGLPKRYEQDGYYILVVDVEKNRLTQIASGQWKDPVDLPNYNIDTKNAVSQLKKGYTALIILKETKPPAFKMTSYVRENQQIMMDAGLRKSAVVFNEKSKMFQKFVMNVVGKLSKVPFKAFDTLEEAEAFLKE